jgi:hypothetical protein
MGLAFARMPAGASSHDRTLRAPSALGLLAGAGTASPASALRLLDDLADGPYSETVKPDPAEDRVN